MKKLYKVIIPIIILTALVGSFLLLHTKASNAVNYKRIFNEEIDNIEVNLYSGLADDKPKVMIIKDKEVLQKLASYISNQDLIWLPFYVPFSLTSNEKEDTLYCLYINNDENKLIGIVQLYGNKITFHPISYDINLRVDYFVLSRHDWSECLHIY